MKKDKITYIKIYQLFIYHIIYEKNVMQVSEFKIAWQFTLQYFFQVPPNIRIDNLC